MKIRANRRLLGLALAPFALFAACTGMTPEQQAEYDELKSEVARIQEEEIAPRQEQLQKIASGGLVVNIEDLQAKVNQIRNEKVQPLEEKLAAVRSGEAVLAAPGTKIELEGLNLKLDELESLKAGLESQIAEYREQRDGAKAAAAASIEDQITALEVELEGLKQQLAELFHDTDVRAGEITASLEELRGQLEGVEPESEDAAALNASIADLEAEWDEIHASESDSAAELEAAIEQIKTQIAGLRAVIEDRKNTINVQFADLIHALEVSLHDISEEKSDLVSRIHELELSSPEELQKTIEELEALIQDIVTGELRPLIEQINASVAGGDTNAVAREQIRAELEEWLAKLAAKKARMTELSSQSFQSMLSGLDLSALGAFANR